MTEKDGSVYVIIPDATVHSTGLIIKGGRKMACPNCGCKGTMVVSSSEYYDEYKCTNCGTIYKEKK